MSGINKVILVGNLGQDPDVRYTPDGKPITNISVATSESWTDKNTGQKQEKTEWHRVVLFGPVAGVAGEYLRKGSKVYIEGKLQTKKWQDQSGQDRYTTEVVVSGFGGTMQMLDSNSNPSQNTSQNQQNNQQQQGSQQQNARQNTSQQQSNQEQQNYQSHGQQNNQQQFDSDIDDTNIPF